MGDKEFDVCEYLWNHELAMQELFSILRQNQYYCSDTECLNLSQFPESRNVSSSTNFLTTCLIIAFVLVMYALRPRSLRPLRNDNAKDRHNGRDSNEEPPAPPPSTQ
ncbi:small integral membrane protein 14 [Nomia melanderi]|uniref:small integral membrane protein 14 n=1 Tax=Nomia melanderi TaxID=2448451 RepID=UPI0013040F46|nr:small integral membrane protein 14 [Nomia melanderi]XP_031836827.1 small integral membrane protein 14 [Nomia melanderi]